MRGTPAAVSGTSCMTGSAPGAAWTAMCEHGLHDLDGSGACRTGSAGQGAGAGTATARAPHRCAQRQAGLSLCSEWGRCAAGQLHIRLRAVHSCSCWAREAAGGAPAGRQRGLAVLLGAPVHVAAEHRIGLAGPVQHRQRLGPPAAVSASPARTGARGAPGGARTRPAPTAPSCSARRAAAGAAGGARACSHCATRGSEYSWFQPHGLSRCAVATRSRRPPSAPATSCRPRPAAAAASLPTQSPPVHTTSTPSCAAAGPAHAPAGLPGAPCSQASSHVLGPLWSGSCKCKALHKLQPLPFMLASAPVRMHTRSVCGAASALGHRAPRRARGGAGVAHSAPMTELLKSRSRARSGAASAPRACSSAVKYGRLGMLGEAS